MISSETRTKGGFILAFDYSKLKGKIKEICGTQDEFARQIGIGRVSLSQRLNNYLDFSQNEIKRACEVLELADVDIPLYFFTQGVQKHERNKEKEVNN
jgi:transcriptional regulator with XRE-family HTH domain